MTTNNSDSVVREGGLMRCGEGTLERRKGVWIAHLKGTYAEMGRQHGALAMQVDGDLIASYFNGLIEMEIKHSIPPLAGPVGKLLKSLFFSLNKKRIGAQLLEHLTGYAEALGLDPVQTQKVIMVPDILHFLIGKFFPQYMPAAAPGCTGFMARGAATAGGKLLVGRNFDFFGQGLWDENNAVIVFEPPEGNKFCWFGSLGVPASGQGMNDAGIIVSLHTKFQRDVRFTGIPLFTLVSDILQNCDKLEDAVKKIQEQPRICGLTLFIVDTKARDAAAVGFSANHVEILRPERDFLVRANHYVTDDMAQHQVAPHPWVLNSTGRFKRVTTIIEEKYGKLAPTDIPKILGDCTDPWEGEKHVAGAIVAAVNNANSIAFSPDDDAVWIANGPFPVCLSERYEGFKISALFARDRAKYEIDDLPGGNPLDANEMAARRHMQKAWTCELEEFRSDLAAFHLRQGAELCPGEAAFPRLAGIILMREHKYHQALPFFEKNAAIGAKNPIMKAESLVWLGRCLDLLGRHEDAKPHYRAAAALDAHPVSTAARKHIDNPFPAKQLAVISPEFIVGTGIAKY